MAHACRGVGATAEQLDHHNGVMKGRTMPDMGKAGVVEHWRQAVETWQDLSAFMDWTARGKKVVTLHSGTVVQALW
jgi:hypothetical protein